MSWVAVGVAGASLVGSMMQNDANGRASADAQKEAGYATRRANEALMNMYEQNRTDSQPWRDQGLAANTQLADNSFMNNWQADPGYQFRMSEGQKALNNAASARGMGNSGATMKALSQYGQNFATNEYNNVYNRNYQRLSGLAGTGASLTGQLMGAGQNTANQIASNHLGYGNSMAAANIAGANSSNQMMGQLIGSGAQLAGSYMMSKK